MLHGRYDWKGIQGFQGETNLDALWLKDIRIVACWTQIVKYKHISLDDFVLNSASHSMVQTEDLSVYIGVKNGMTVHTHLKVQCVL